MGWSLFGGGDRQNTYASTSQTYTDTDNLNLQGVTGYAMAGVDNSSLLVSNSTNHSYADNSSTTTNNSTTDFGAVEQAAGVTERALASMEAVALAQLNATQSWAANQSLENRDFASSVIERSRSDEGLGSEMIMWAALAVVAIAVMR